MQKQLFDIPAEKSAKKNDLAIVKPGKQALTKQQKEFNRLVKKIEKLRGDIPLVTAALNNNLNYYATHIHPLEKKLVIFRVNGVKIFYPYYTGEKKSLSKKEKETLREVMATALNEIFYLSPDQDDEEIKTIYEAVHGESFDDVKKDAFYEMKDDLAAQFRDAGVNINLDDLEPDMTEEEIMRKMKEKQGEFERQGEEMRAKDAAKKKTKKQLEQEEREKHVAEAKKKSIGAIYRQLVKAFHPDLEQDEEIKLQKEVIMKQLTVAYENNDLHTLLKLEIEWITKENNDPGKLSNDKLDIYNDALKEQVAEMQQELDMLEHHPRYVPLQRFSHQPGKLRMRDMMIEKANMEETLHGLEAEERKLKGANAVQFIKNIIHSFKISGTQSNEMEDMLEELMRMMNKPSKGRSFF